ncbi:hypothetical protein DUNSADRAFT_5312 [Dunaliella salina]|uniref:Secreted protein n=1 Tax=Dunaliella salina TaxID=3046 RepID=A0ABQ7GQP9_DUNSA|nr:hypothetical protein DUNSADRAFT_5312 [Dunaliella salina]|eukprot:KAF5836873.1 hypothetical protein DUNSADRAFT_5312 [Dunaliella salina]
MLHAAGLGVPGRSFQFLSLYTCMLTSWKWGWLLGHACVAHSTFAVVGSEQIVLLRRPPHSCFSNLFFTDLLI